MNDSCEEWLVKRKPVPYAIPVKILLVILCAFSAFIALVNVFGILLLTAVGAATYFIFQNLSVEFEYQVVSDQITIDKILGKARRKTQWNGVMSDVQIVAPADSYILKDYETQNMKLLDYSSHSPHGKVYAMISQKSGKTEKILFEPNDKILQCIRNHAPRKVIL